MIFRSSKRTRRDRKQDNRQREARRRRLARLATSHVPTVENLEDRRLLAVVGYDAANEDLTFTADAGDADDVRLIGNDIAGTLQIVVGNGDELSLADDAVNNPDFVLSSTITTNDTLTIDLTGSSISTATVHAGDMNDRVDASAEDGVIIDELIINGGSGDDQLTGSDFGDSINGDEGIDTIFGMGSGDVIVGGTGADIIHGGDDSDTIIWNNGDGSDTINGDGGFDDVVVNGSTVSPAGDDFTISSDGVRFRVTRADGGAGLGPFSLNIGGVELFELNTLDGDDTVSVEDLAGVNDLRFIEIDAGVGEDSFHVVPSQVSVELDGADPATAPGDSLVVDLTNTTGATANVAGPGRGDLIFTSGQEPIRFANIESAATIGGQVAIGPINIGNGNDDISLLNDSGELVLNVGGNDFFRMRLADIAGPLTINGNGGDDDLTVDFTGGSPIPDGGLVFNGGSSSGPAGDSLSVVGSFTNQILNYDAPGADGNNGSIDLDTQTITYTGLEPITAGNSVNTVLNLPGGLSNDATLRDSANAGEIEIVDNGATFEDTIIPNPTNSLTVNLGDQGDSLAIDSLDTGYAASTVLNGGNGNDSIRSVGVIYDTGGSGRGLEVNGVDSLVISGGAITNNTAVVGGGLLLSDVGSATISGTTISGNTATGNAGSEGGGGIFNFASSLNINQNAQITGNVANGSSGSGGGILNSSGGTLTITDSTISGNTANRAGGGIEDNSGAGLGITLTNVNLDNNDTGGGNGPGNGGGLHVTGAGNVDIIGGTVNGNTAASEGGGLWNGSGTMTISGTTIDGNTASGNAADEGGGGVFNAAGAVNVVANTTISNNIADGTSGSGGGILNDGGILTVDSSTIEGNTANRAGGGIEQTGQSTTDLLDADLIDNVAGPVGSAAPGNGGGLHVTGAGDVLILNGLVDGNLAALEGGGLWNGSGTMLIDGTVITGNTASGDAADDGGGGIFNNGGTLDIIDATILGNLADGSLGSGGGLFSTGGQVDITSSSVDFNGANRAGGGIEIVDGLVTLVDVFLEGNDVDGSSTGGVAAPGNGGGLHVSGVANVLIDGGVVSANIAASEGGGLWNQAGSTMTVDGATIEFNTALGDAADNGGGGIFNNGGTLIVRGADIVDNVASGTSGSGGGIFNDVGGTLTVTNSTISRNSASRAGGGIEDNSGAGLGVTLTDVVLNNNNTGGGNGPGNGGGLHITGAGDVSITGGSVNGNTAASEGGGLWNGSGTMTIDGTRIDGNVASGASADQGGGGIFNNGGVVTIGQTTPVTIANNIANGAAGSGGGILNDGGTLTITASSIIGNSAVRAGGGIEVTTVNGRDSVATLNLVSIAGNVVGASPGNGGGVHVTAPAGSANSSLFDITGGSVVNNVAASEGGGLWNDAQGTMNIQGVDIDGNTASGNDATNGGGGVFNNGGVVNINLSTITNNDADGLAGSGGGIFNDGGEVNVALSFIDGNTAQRAGGGIEDLGGETNVLDSTISRNNAGSTPGNGGGIHISAAGTVNIDGVTIDNNTAVEGGGVWVSGAGTFHAVNSTISTNSATGSDGGGLFNVAGGTIDLDSVTITLNQASTNIGNGIQANSGSVTIENSIVAQNAGPNNSNPGNGESNLAGSIISEDYNLIGDADNGVLTGPVDHTLFESNAFLLPLANYGGPVGVNGMVARTHLPASGSPAIDMGYGDVNLGQATVTVDQRDVSRPQGGRKDIGAVEADLIGYTVDAGAAAGDGNVDHFRIVNDGDLATGTVQVFVNSSAIPVLDVPRATTGVIVIRGSADNDTLIVDSSNGLIAPNIIFDGDGTGGGTRAPGGLDSLQFINLPLISNFTYNPGEENGDGAAYLDDNQQIQSIEFFGLEPIQVLAPAGGNNTLNLGAAPLGVGFPQALNNNNVISYVEGPNSNEPADIVFAGAVTGMLTVDSFESLEFANFETLNIDAGSGSDQISLNHDSANGPSELTTINVEGGNPTAGTDVVIINGQSTADAVSIDNVTADGAEVTGAQTSPVNVTGAEQLLLNGQGGDDTLTLTAPGVVVSHTPAAAADAGSIQAGTLLPIAYSHIGAAGSVTIDGASALIALGTSTGDSIAVSATTGTVTHTAGGQTRVALAQANVNALVIEGLSGDDTITVAGNHPYAGGVTVNGGQPDSGSDILNFVGGGAAVTVDVDAQTITESGFGPVSYAGVETVNVDANADLTVTGGAADDTFDVTPGAANSGSFTHSGSTGVAFNYSDATSATFNGGGGTDELNIFGDAAADAVTATADTLTVNGSSVTLGAGLEAVSLSTGAGNDSVDLAALTFAMGVTIDTGAGDDTIVGTDQDDLILAGIGNDQVNAGDGNDIVFGGAGNDILIGGAGDDTQHGEDGQDIFGNATLVGDGVADDPGTDYNFGGNGFDNFIWEPGDGTDFNNGGDDAADILRFFGNAGDNTITLRSGGTPTHFNALFGAAVIDNHGIEDVRIDPLGGNDTITVNDLFQTEVVNVTILAGGGDETVTVDGRTVSDALEVTAGGGDVSIEGLRYDVNILSSSTADALTVNANDGDDSVHVGGGVQAIITSTVNGGFGDDSLTGWFNTANGEAGNDTIGGAANDQTFDGGSGDDTLLLTESNIGGTDLLVGGAGADRVLVQGGLSVDDIDVSTTTIDINGAGPTTLDAGSNGIELLQIEAGDGNNDVDVTGIPAGDYATLAINSGDGADDINVDAAVTIGAVIRSGAGDDVIRGGSGNDIIFAGAGNDILIGGAGDDTQHGEDGQDIFGNATLVGDGVADDPGTDYNFGGNGFDNFIWEPGDGTDFNNGGDDAADILRFFGNAGDNTITLRSGGTPTHFNALFGAAVIDNHGIEDVRIDPLGGNDTITVNDLFQTEVVNVTILAGGGDESVTVDGRTTADALEITRGDTSVSIEGLSYDVNLADASTADTLTVNTHEGDDSVHVGGGVQTVITSTVNGGAGDDSLTGWFNTANGDSGSDTIIGANLDQVLSGGDGDDVLDGRGGTNTVDGGAGSNTLLATGTAGDDVLDVTHTAGTVEIVGGLSAGIQNIANIERVLIEAGSGSDTINLTTLGGGVLDYDILGGDPIGAVGDTLNVTSPTGVSFTPGPESDSGAFVDGDGAEISFDEIEAASVTLTNGGVVVVMGTGADDDITLEGVATNVVDVTVNGGPTVRYNNVNQVDLLGKQGDDDITIDVNVADLDVTINVDGGLPTAGSDELRVTGVAGSNDTPNWAPGTGVLALDGQSPINVVGIETLIYDGESDNENLTVTGSVDDESFESRPGSAIDAGFIGVRSGDAEQLGIHFENLGTDGDVTVAGGAGSDSLTALATIEDDDVAITFSAAGAIDLDLISDSGAYVDLLSTDVEDFDVQTLDGNDNINVTGSVLANSFDVFAGGPGGSDALAFIDNPGAADTYVVDPIVDGTGNVTVNGTFTTYRGVENLVVFASTDTDDSLTVNDPLGDNDWKIDSFGGTDRIAISGVSPIFVTGLDTISLNNTDGVDTFDIEPTSLTGFVTSLTINGNLDDVINFIGTEAADAATSTGDAVTVNGVEVTIGNTGFAQLSVQSLGGDDVVDLDLDLAGVHKVVELGAGNDSLDASGMLDGDFFGGIGNDIIVGSPLADRIFGGAGDDTLIGGGGDDYQYGEDGNDIFGNPNLVGDGVADDPGSDRNFGGNGFDNFIWEPGDGTDFNNGGDDQADIFRFFGRDAADTFTLRSGGTPTHFNALFNAAVIDNHGIEDVLIVPLGGNDTIVVNDLFQTEVVNVTIAADAGDEAIRVEGRTTADALEITRGDTSVSIEGLSYDVNITDASTTDTLTVNTNEGDDSVHVGGGVQAIITSTLNGGFGDDSLTGWFNTANGDAGNDTIGGAANDQTFDGGSGDDTLLLTESNIGGTDLLVGGAGADRVLVQGGLSVDDIDVSTTTIDINGAGPTTLDAGSNGIELLQIEAGDGNNDVDVTGIPAGDYATLAINSGDGADDINVDAAVTIGAVIRSGAGDDVIRGGSGNDIIFAGAGNDILIGGAGDDTQHGEDGQDIFGNATLVGDGVADDPGTDYNFGGNGFDNFIWEPGDGTDFNNGGDDAADILRFFGNAGDNTITLRSGGTPTHFNALFGAAVIDNHGIEDVRIDPLGGNDTITVNDLFQTEVVNVTILAGGGDESVTVDGRTTADTLEVTRTVNDHVSIEGLAYDVNVLTPETADTITINTFDGDDRVNVELGVEDVITSTLNGGVGSDLLTGAFNTANGDAGDDTIEGSDNDQALNGGAGEDVFVGGGGLDTIDGGTEYDQILIRGTSAADAISVTQSAAGTLDFSVNGVADTDTIVTAAGTPTVESVRVEAGDGADTIVATWSDALGVDTDANSLRIEIDGGDDFAADRLGVLDDGTGDMVIQHVGAVITSGGVEIGPANDEPLKLTYENVEILQPIAATDGRVEVFKHDPFEFNDARTISTHLGAGETLNVDPTINPGIDPIFGLPADVDYFRLEAETTGTLDIQAFFEQIATVASGRPGLPGNGDLSIQLYDEDGDLIAGAGAFGTADTDDNARIRIPVVQEQVYFLQVFGATTDAINAYDLTIVNEAPPTPFDLELDDAVIDGVAPEGSDTGRNNTDNITMDNTPTIFFRLDDAILLNDVVNPVDDDAIPIPFQVGPVDAGFAIAVFDEGQTPGTGAGTVASQTPLGYATQVAGVPGLYTFTTPVLSDGSHFLSARVEMIDPSDLQASAFGARSQSLEIIVDTVIPPGSFGLPGVVDDGLVPDSDSGVIPNPHTFDDLITNDTTPTFWGQAEANTIVKLYVDINNDGVLDAGDAFIGQTTAIPLDGNLQEPDGFWMVESIVDFNDDDLFPVPNGLRTVFATVEDVAGNVSNPAFELEIFIDTVGPVVDNVYITSDPGHNLFGLKNFDGTTEPTPPANSLSIDFTDNPNRVAPNFLIEALKEDVALTPGQYVLRGDHSGIIAIDDISIVQDVPVDGQPATATVTLTFFEPLPDDRYTLTISDGIVDLANNGLDGESNASEPNGGFPELSLPSGDGIPGGDFVARFTVDSRPEIGTISQGIIYADINGNFVYDPEGQDNDAVNRDFVYQFGQLTDAHFAGNFADRTTGIASGFDKLGAYGFFNNTYSFLLDTDDDGVGDLASVMPNLTEFQVNGIPIAGDFSAANDGDEIGLFDGTALFLDLDGDFNIEVGERIPTNYNGLPIAGDFNGDGTDDIAVYVNDTNTFIFDTNLDGFADDTLVANDDFARFFGQSGFTDRPIAGDLNLDGIDDLGLWVTNREGQLPEGAGEWFFLVSDQANPLPSNVFDAYSPSPLGNDLYAQFGNDFALPIFGNFDPPTAANQDGSDDYSAYTNGRDRHDVNGDGIVSPIDALLVINALGRGTELSGSADAARMRATEGTAFLDVDGSSSLSPLDALRVINELGRRSQAAESEGEQASLQQYEGAVDSVFADSSDDEDDDDWLLEDRLGVDGSGLF